MGDPPKPEDGADPSAAAYISLIDAIKTTERTIERAPKATTKGIVPLERPPATPDSESDS
ncbi:MAG: hypothetical protein JO257_30145 [Deltaproteobacteria bacterium]|nr:hypothetical protein [Deltaproteobacteria bacterium]